GGKQVVHNAYKVAKRGVIPKVPPSNTRNAVRFKSTAACAGRPEAERKKEAAKPYPRETPLPRNPIPRRKGRLFRHRTRFSTGWGNGSWIGVDGLFPVHVVFDMSSSKAC
ncbi:MAG: hypothetical protein CSA75_00995, partial [Sorangium cellulosum]